MNLGKNYSQSSIDLRDSDLVSYHEAHRSRSVAGIPLMDPIDGCGYGYQEGKKPLPKKFPYELAATVGNPIIAQAYAEKYEKGERAPWLERMEPYWLEFRRRCGPAQQMMALAVFKVLLVIFWFWVGLSLINLFKSAELSFDKRHCVIPKVIRLDKYAYYLTQLDAEEVSVNLKLHGPFIPFLQQNREYNEDLMRSDAQRKYVFVCALERWIYKPALKNPNLHRLKRDDASHYDISPTGYAKIMMTNKTGTTHTEPLDYNNYPRQARLSLPKTSFSNTTGASVFYALGFGVDKSQTKSVPFSMEYKVDPISMRTRVLIGMIALIVLGGLVTIKMNPGVAAFVAMCTALAGYVKTGRDLEVMEMGQWLNADLILYLFFVMLLISVLVETRIYSCLAYHFVMLTQRSVGTALVLINVLPAVLCVYFNNMFIALLCAPLAIRLMELLDRNPFPVLINLMMICNICGKAYVGTFIVKAILQHIEAKNALIDLKKIMDICLNPCLIIAGITGAVWYLIYTFIKPHEYRKRLDVAETEQLMGLWNRLSYSIPDVSLRWHYIRLKIRRKRFQLNEKLEKLKEEDIPEYKETRTMAYYKELRLDNSVYNWYLVAKCLVAGTAFVLLMHLYMYNYYFKKLHEHGDLRLGYLALFCILLLLLLLHSRDYELLMKRIDWQTLLIFMSLGVITAVFTTLTAHMDDYLWKLYGTTMTGSRKRKVHMVFAQMLSYCSVSGIANEHTMSIFFLDTVLTFSIFRGFDAVGELLGGFIMATGFWGTATILGTGANLLIAGLSETNGYQIRFIKHMWYGVPFAFMSIILLYIYISYRYLI